MLGGLCNEKYEADIYTYCIFAVIVINRLTKIRNVVVAVANVAVVAIFAISGTMS